MAEDLDLETIEARRNVLTGRGFLEHGPLGSRLHQLVNKDIPALTREVRRLREENERLLSGMCGLCRLGLEAKR